MPKRKHKRQPSLLGRDCQWCGGALTHLTVFTWGWQSRVCRCEPVAERNYSLLCQLADDPGWELSLRPLLIAMEEGRPIYLPQAVNAA